MNESVDIIEGKIDFMNKTLKSLHNSEFKLREKTLCKAYVAYYGQGIVFNAAPYSQSTMRRFICSATARQFNESTIKKDVDIQPHTFGLSVLHARIR